MPRASTYHRWSDDEIDALIEMFRDGCTDAEIATELGMTRQQVHLQRHRLSQSDGSLKRGRIGKPIDIGMRQRFILHLSRGITVSDVARLLGISTGVAGRTARRLARDGLLRRLGTRTSNVRYEPIEG